MRIPFEFDVDDFNEVGGFLYLEDDYLVFEYDILILGITKRDHEVVKAERGAITDVFVRRGFIKDRVVVKTHSLKLLNAIPGKHASEIELKIKKRHRREAEEFTEMVLDWMDAKE